MIALRQPDGLLAGPDREAPIDGAIVDLGGRRYDGIEAIAIAAGRKLPVLAVGQHDDVALRRRALAAGAERVLSYNKMHRDGPAVLGRWLAGHAGHVAASDLPGEPPAPAPDAASKSAR